MGACFSASPGEAMPLVAEESKTATPTSKKPNNPLMMFVTPLVITFYICVAVVKTLLTKVLLNDDSAPVALSCTSCWVTCVVLVPIFIIKPSTWGVLDIKKNGAGFALVTLLVTLDLAFTNISMSLLAIAIQQCILAVNPAFTVVIESIVRRRLNHPVIYLTVAVLCVGPVLTNLGPNSSSNKSSIGGIIAQLFGVLNSACKYVFAHAVMQDCKKDLGSFAFLFWLDAATLIILIPWSFIDGSTIRLYSSLHSGLDWAKLFGTSFLGGLRFFSQLMVLRVTTATNLSCANIGFQALNIYISLALFHDRTIDAWLIGGTALTITTSAVYTYYKISKILTKAPVCIKVNDDFRSCVGIKPKDPSPKMGP